jgi:HD-GYP domain-containing protein (c-di-GMP phosphodiesterase class II)
MFRRRPQENAPVEIPDSSKAAGDLLATREPGALLDAALAHALSLAPAASKAWAVLHEGGTYRIAAVRGYARDLLDLQVVGSWADGAPRIVSNVAGELFQPNSQEARTRLGNAGMREVRNSLVVPLRDRREQRGALFLDAYGPESFSPSSLEAVTRWAGVVGPALGQVRDFANYRRLALGLTLSFVEAVETSDFANLGHAQRVTSYATALGQELKFTQDELRDLWFAAMLHDLGKLTMTDLGPAEHARRGYNMLSSLEGLEVARLGVLHHHERFDGNGGPEGLSGQAIPLFARLIAVADRYDHLTSERGELLRPSEAIERMRASAGRELDPALVDSLDRLVKQAKDTGELRPRGLFPE